MVYFSFQLAGMETLSESFIMSLKGLSMKNVGDDFRLVTTDLINLKETSIDKSSKTALWFNQPENLS